MRSLRIDPDQQDFVYECADDAVVVVDTVHTICQFLAKQTPQKPISWLLKLSPQVTDNLQTWYDCSSLTLLSLYPVLVFMVLRLSRTPG